MSSKEVESFFKAKATTMIPWSNNEKNMFNLKCKNVFSQQHRTYRISLTHLILTFRILPNYNCLIQMSTSSLDIRQSKLHRANTLNHPRNKSDLKINPFNKFTVNRPKMNSRYSITSPLQNGKKIVSIHPSIIFTKATISSMRRI